MAFGMHAGWSLRQARHVIQSACTLFRGCDAAVGPNVATGTSGCLDVQLSRYLSLLCPVMAPFSNICCSQRGQMTLAAAAVRIGCGNRLVDGGWMPMPAGCTV